MFPPVDTKHAAAVAAYVEASYKALFPGANAQRLSRVFHDTNELFQGRTPNYGAVDLRYHDHEHTLQATVCVAQILRGRQLAGTEPRLTARQFELGIIATLLHDTGYLKLRSDTAGTGAKYTYCHVLRSCAFAASYLPAVGATEEEIEAVLGAINCTGPVKQVSRLNFRDPLDRVVGCALATGDYLGQMAASDYPDELEILFLEFKESDDFVHVPLEQRMFTSAAALIKGTPGFWRDFVLPKLQTDFEGVYRFLAEPYPLGRNAYLDAVEENIAIIAARPRMQAASSAA